MVKYLSFMPLAAMLVLGGCSTKEYYEPQNVKGEYAVSGSLEAEIVDTGTEGALLQNNRVAGLNGLLDVRLPQGHRLIGQSDGWVISDGMDGTLLFQGEDANRTLELKKSVAAASVKEDKVAVLFTSNEMALFSLASGEMFFKEQGSAPIALDARIVNPYFLNELVLFLTLDGKIVIVNSDTKTVLRSIIISSEDHFNNVIYFNVLNNILVAGTPSRVLAFGAQEAREDYELRDMIYNDEGVWLSTKQGEVIALTPSLQLKAKQKFPFAHFLGMIYSDGKLYLLEREGYMIVMDKSLESYEVYEVDIDEGYVFAGEKRFYVKDAYIDIK